MLGSEMCQRPYSYLSTQWMQSGVESGDCLMLHTSLRRTLSSEVARSNDLGPSDVLRSFLDVLGPKGTLIVPLFNFGFCDGDPFDIRSTQSNMGAFTECARLWPGAVRTGHPVYSFAVLGFHAPEFLGVDNESAFGPDSPFAHLLRLNGKVGALDLEENDSMTFHHFVEESCGAVYRYLKPFSAEYTNAKGETCTKRYLINVRNIEMGVETYANPAGELLWEAGLYRGSRPHYDSGLRVINANEMFTFMSRIILGNRAEGVLYRIVHNLPPD